MKQIYWLLIRNIIICTLTCSSTLIKLVPVRYNIGLTLWFNSRITGRLRTLLVVYIIMILFSQIIITMNCIGTEINVIESKFIRMHTTYGICILSLLIMWLDYTIQNFSQIPWWSQHHQPKF